MKRKRGLVVVRTAVHPKRPPPCDGEWADTVEKLKLTTEDSQFYEWKPGVPIHFVQKGESGVKSCTIAQALYSCVSVAGNKLREILRICTGFRFRVIN